MYVCIYVCLFVCLFVYMYVFGAHAFMFVVLHMSAYVERLYWTVSLGKLVCLCVCT